MAKRALVTGITGQDGAYFAKFLLGKGYDVQGVVRRSSHGGVADHRLRWLGVVDDVHLQDANLVDMSSLSRLVEEIRPDEFYNLAATATGWSPERALADTVRSVFADRRRLLQAHGG